MAEPIVEQDEIDQLLNQINDATDGDSPEDYKEKEISIREGTKIFRPFRKPIEKFNYPTKSPVIKRKNVVLNPKDTYNPKKNETVVYTMAGYLRHKHRSQAMSSV